MSDTRKVILVMADISGYTRFMMTNKLEVLHSQVIISELIKTIIDQVEIPIEVSKLEGDAIFLHAVKDDSDAAAWDNTRKAVGSKLLKFFDAFSNKISELSGTNMCVCKACKNITQLKLKVIVHSGEALFYSINKFQELSGVDVIIVHRLLKNSVRSNEYILMTEQAYKDIEFPEKVPVSESKEEYDEIGKINTYVYQLPASVGPLPYTGAQFSISSKIAHTIAKEYKTVLILLGIKIGPKLNI
ncbi:MAG TPA: DUF2652 domain-containing protein [Syntrophales bacterium]|nr:DUF2652 domain-containing protein [Syntrophales bacterium]